MLISRLVGEGTIYSHQQAKWWLSVRVQDRRSGFFTNEQLEQVVSPEEVEEVNELDEM